MNRFFTMIFLAAVSVMTLPASSVDIAETFSTRMSRLGEWYLPGRLGVFYHWGLFTGGGVAATNPKIRKPLTYKDASSFDAAAPDPDLVARNMAALAKEMGAKYAILTLWHTCGRHFVLFPTEHPAFFMKSRKDYIDAYLKAMKEAGIRAMLYFPTDCNNWDMDPANLSLDRSITATGSKPFVDAVETMLDELKSRYGSRIDGFWLDGGLPGHARRIPALIRARWPKTVIVANNFGLLTVPEVDMTTTEEYCGVPEPDYNRPSAYRRKNQWGTPLPPRDFNEDIPTLNGWWYRGEAERDNKRAAVYVDDPKRLVRMVVSSLGQRGMWNCAVGIGPRIDGTIQPRLAPAIRALKDYLAWAGESVYGTRGAAGTFFEPGWWNARKSEGFYSVTQSTGKPDTFYVSVTEARHARINRAVFATNGRVPKRVSDLRTGRTYPFSTPHGTIVDDIDWSDIETYGATVLKFEF